MNVNVYGLGYVGSVSAACLAAAGHWVVGVDSDETRLGALASGQTPVSEPGLPSLVSNAVTSGHLRSATSVHDGLAEADVVLICVGTPPAPDGTISVDHVVAVVADIVSFHRDQPRSKDLVIVVRSTVPPGTVNKKLVPLISDCPLVSLAVCPEFLRETTAISDFHSPPYLVVGSPSIEIAQIVFDLFATVDAPRHSVSVETAECVKLAANAFHATKVAFANEINRFCEMVGVSGEGVMELVAAANTGAGSRYLRPGFAFGGSCLTKDLQGLLASSQHTGSDDDHDGHPFPARGHSAINLPLLAGVLESNDAHCQRLVDHIVAEGWRKVLIVGLAFKPGSGDYRGSPFVDAAQRIVNQGVDVHALRSSQGNNPEVLGGGSLPSVRWVDPWETASLGGDRGYELVVVGSESHDVVEALRRQGVPVLVAAESALCWPVNEKATPRRFRS